MPRAIGRAPALLSSRGRMKRRSDRFFDQARSSLSANYRETLHFDAETSRVLQNSAEISRALQNSHLCIWDASEPGDVIGRFAGARQLLWFAVGTGCLGTHRHFPRHELSLIYDATRTRWIHENHTTGEKIELLGPWKVMGNLSAVNQKFDDMREAIEHFNPQRARQIKSHEPSYLCLYSICRSC